MQPSKRVCKAVVNEFEVHAKRLKESARERRNSVSFKNVVEDDEERSAIAVEDTLGKRQPSDVYDGDVALRTLRTLLSFIDNRGWERLVYAILAQCVAHARSALSVRSCGVWRVCPAFNVSQVCPPTSIPQRIRAVCGARALPHRMEHAASGHHATQWMVHVQLGGHDFVSVPTRTHVHIPQTSRMS